jgi:hypothetical protein
MMLGSPSFRTLTLALLSLSCSSPRSSASKLMADSVAARSARRTQVKAELAARTSARLIPDSVLNLYGGSGVPYTIDLQRILLGQASPVILETNLQDIAETDEGTVAIFGPRFEPSAIYLRLKVAPASVGRLLHVPRDPFGKDILVSVKVSAVSRPLFAFRTRDRSSSDLPPALEADLGEDFLIEGELVDWSIYPE